MLVLEVVIDIHDLQFLYVISRGDLLRHVLSDIQACVSHRLFLQTDSVSGSRALNIKAVLSDSSSHHLLLLLNILFAHCLYVNSIQHDHLSSQILAEIHFLLFLLFYVLKFYGGQPLV